MPGRKQKIKSGSKSFTPPPTPCPSLHDDDCKDDGPGSPKRGRKESEQKRRVLMNQYFDELVSLISLLSQRHIPKKIDKVATLRETITSLKAYYYLTTLDPPPLSSPSPKSEKPGRIIDRGDALELVINSQDAFLAMVADSGRIMFSTSLITSLLGYIQTRLIGQNWYDYVHENDKELFHSIFTESASTQSFQVPNTTITVFPPKLCTLRLQLYSGETGGLPQFLPFKCMAYLRKWDASSCYEADALGIEDSLEEFVPLPDEQHYVLLIGKLPTSLTSIDLPVGTNDVNFEFELRVSKKGRIISIEDHAILVIGYSSAEIHGTSFFDYVDPYHLSEIAESISSFVKTGLGTTTPYRFMTKSGRYIWLISKTYTSYNPWINKPDHILLTNRVLGCDQILPEHRFYRSRKLLPDLDSEQEYTVSHSKLLTPPILEKKPVPNLQQNPLVEKHLADMKSSTSIVNQLPEAQSFLSSIQLPSTAARSAATCPQRFSQGPSQSWMPKSGPPTSTPTSAAAAAALPQSLLEIQRELERKNREIFEMQQRLLEQQKLFEAERNQFYQVSQQVMHCISASNAQPSGMGVKMDPQSHLNLPMIPKSFSQPKTLPCITDIPPSPVNQRVSTPAPVSQELYSTSSAYHTAPPTPQSAYSPYSNPQSVYSIHSPGQGTPCSAQTPTPVDPYTQHSNMEPFQQMYPCATPQSTYASMPSPTFAQGPGSLAMHNDLVCDTLGLAAANGQLGASIPSSTISHIETLSNMFGGH